MVRPSPQIESVASPLVRWACALAVTAAIAVYLGLHLPAITTALVKAFEALRG